MPLLSSSKQYLPKADVEILHQKVAENFEKIIEKLKKISQIPSIASAGFSEKYLWDSAEMIKTYLENINFSDVEILTADLSGISSQGAPAIVARKPAKPGFPTVLLYAHHDVQPAGNIADWESDPFFPVEKNGRLYGRGVADDKAGIIAHIAALELLEQIYGDDFGLGVTVFFEGEEEIGSPSFKNFLHKYKDKLVSDTIIVADSVNWEIGTPALTSSLRGVISGVIELEILDHEVHSGIFGGPILDSLVLMSRLVATFHDKEGNVSIAGLISDEENQTNYTEERFRKDSSLVSGAILAGSGSIASRLWSKPAFAVLGIDAPEVEGAASNLIAKTAIKFGLRVAPSQNLQEAIEAFNNHIDNNIPFGAKVSIRDLEAGSGYKADRSSSVNSVASWALGEAWGNVPEFTGLGGSIPFISDFETVFPEAKILITGVEDPDSRAHSANESLHLEEYKKAILGEVLLLAGICFNV